MSQLAKKVEVLEQISVLLKIEKHRFFDQNPYPENRSLWMAHGKSLREKWEKRKAEYTCELWGIATGKQLVA